MKPNLLLTLLARAREEEMGLAVETNNPMYLYQQLQDTNKSPDLIITRPAIEGWVFIVKRSVELQP